MNERRPSLEDGRLREHSSLASRLGREAVTAERMIEIFCRDHHGTDSRLCDGCRDLLDYVERRLERCPFGEGKPSCKECPIHCYTSARRTEIQAVMRHAGPRMLRRHPLLALLHLFDGWRRPGPGKVGSTP